MIGVFDSGSGGLSVLRAIVDKFPDEPFIYLGDHKNTPYGPKTRDQVFHLTTDNMLHLFDMGCTLVILACNTASAYALRRIQQTWLAEDWPDHRVLGVLVPMVEAVAKVPWSCKEAMVPVEARVESVGIFATQGTVDSGAYVREIATRAPEVEVYQEACPELVELIEHDASHATIRTRIAEHAENLKLKAGGTLPEAIILGCTHYPLIEDDFVAVLPQHTQVYSQSKIVAESLGDYVRRHPQHLAGTTGPTRFLTTGNPAKVNEQASKFFGRAIAFEPTEVPHALSF